MVCIVRFFLILICCFLVLVGDILDAVWEWIKVILLWLLIIGGIVLGSFFGICGVCDIVWLWCRVGLFVGR